VNSKISVIWLNYNSKKFLSLALASLNSVFDLDVENFEIIIVDNASTDGSFESIVKFVNSEGRMRHKVRIIRSDKNRGYSGGMNLGWEARDHDSRYVAFLNNDLIADPDSLREIVERMNAEPDVGAASGLIYFGDGRTIYSAGGVVTELWNAGGVCHGAPESECSGRERAHYVTYADGAYMVARVDAVRDTSLKRPFLDRAFFFFDDYVLGLMLWNRRWKVRYYPVNAGLHFAHKTLRSEINYYGIRAHIALMKNVKTRFETLWPFYLLRRSAIHSGLCATGRLGSCSVVRALYDGLRLGSYAKNRIGILELYKGPYIRSTCKELECFIAGICEDLKIMHRDILINNA